MRFDSSSTVGSMEVDASSAAHWRNAPPVSVHDPRKVGLDRSRAFTQYANDNRLRGYHGPCESRPYVSLAKLQEYWNLARIREVLSMNCRAPIPPRVIKDNYLRVFSTLVFTDQVSWLPAFSEAGLDDRYFPSETIPNRWPENPSLHGDLWGKFAPAQWMFFPYIFDPERLLNSRIPSDCVLPLNWVKLMVPGEVASVYKIEIHREYNKLPEDPATIEPNTFVLKTYTGERGHELYDNEKNALMALQNNPSEHIVTYYGSFRHGEQRSLILEYISGGTLLELIHSNSPPKTDQDFRDFWNSLINVLQGLFRVHQITNHAEHAAEYRAIHEDLKPDNILLQPQQGGTKYQFCSKIVDFGCSHLRSVDPHGVDEGGIDHHGHPRYCAPENTHHQRWMQSGPNRLSSAADIWSMGCIISEVASWVVLGTEGHESYRRDRQNEIRRYTTFDGSGSSDCFHNGSKALRAVKETHARINKSRQPWDDITPSILHAVEHYMLVWNPGDRWEAKSLMETFQHILAQTHETPLCATPDDIEDHVPEIPGSEPELQDLASKLEQLQTARHRPSASSGSLDIRESPKTPSDPSSSISSPPGATRHPTRSFSRRQRLKSFGRSSFLATSPIASPMLRSPSPTAITRSGTPMEDHLSIEDVLGYREDRKYGRPVDPRVNGMIVQLQRTLSSRDHIFFIEDSPTMKQHITNITRTFIVLSYLAKQIDTDEIELVFASSPFTIHSHQNTTPLIEKLEQHNFEQVQSMMESQLGEFIEKHVIRRLPRHAFPAIPTRFKKPVSIIVFTDGCWGANLPDAAGVENPVRNLMGEMDRRNVNRTQVMMQFIRFGNSLDGKRYLKCLDDFGQATKNDIVDTRAADGNVYAMFIGSLNQAMDNVEDEEYMPTVYQDPRAE